MARELGKYGIRVNAVSPGAIPTAAREAGLGRPARDLREVPARPSGAEISRQPEDIAKAILFLVSDKARFITGQNLTVDGGWWMH